MKTINIIDFVLDEYKRALSEHDDLYLKTVNKSNGFVGVASFFTNGEKKIRVNEGNPDGSDDADYSYEEFINNYEFQLLNESEE